MIECCQQDVPRRCQGWKWLDAPAALRGRLQDAGFTWTSVRTEPATHSQALVTVLRVAEAGGEIRCRLIRQCRQLSALLRAAVVLGRVGVMPAQWVGRWARMQTFDGVRAPACRLEHGATEVHADTGIMRQKLLQCVLDQLHKLG
jgi:hypothetical protein